VATVREDIRSHTLQVDAAEIPRRVEAVQAGKPVRIDSVDVPSTSGADTADEQASSPVVERRNSKDYGTDEVDSEVRVSPVVVQCLGDSDSKVVFRKGQGHRRISVGG
jgi:hypothetical protein